MLQMIIWIEASELETLTAGHRWLPLMRAWAGVSGWGSGERGSQTVGGSAQEGLFESLPGSLYSLLADTHSIVPTPIVSL